MNAETFCEHFATFTDAPNGVVKLREMILQLAVQGKVVPQDPNDEPAVSLRKKLAKRAIELHEAGRATRPKPLPAIEETDWPFDPPPNWEWVRFGELAAEVEYGTSQKASEIGGDVPVLRMNAIRDGKVILEESKFVSSTIDDLPRLYLKNGDILFNRTNSFELVGKSGVFNGPDDKYTFASYLIRGCLHPQLSPAFVVMAMNATYFRKTQIEPEVTQQCGQANFNGTKWRNALIPLPPLAEQRRIVAKVDQLLTLCDELESRQAARREARERLVGATLDRVVSSRSSAEFPAQVHRLRDHFDSLFDTPTTIPQLRQAILQLAVQGKLVQQDLADESAEMAVEKVERLRQTLITEKVIKALDCAPIAEDEIEHQIPDTWVWSRLGHVCRLITDGTHYTPKYTPDGRIFLSAQNVKPFSFQPELHRFVSEGDYQEYVKNKKAEFEDVLLTRVGAGIGEAAVINQRFDFAFYVSLGLLRPFRECFDPYFLAVWLNSPIGRRHSQRNTLGKGVSQGNLNLSLIRSFVVPIPPLAEQKRIVTKVTELLKCCDVLEAKLTQAESATTELLSASVHHLLSS